MTAAVIALVAGALGVAAHAVLWRRVPRLALVTRHRAVSAAVAGVLTALLSFGLAVAAPSLTVAAVDAFFALVAVQLSFIDLKLQILPNIIVLPSIVAAAVLLTATAVVVSDGEALLRGLLGGGILFLTYLTLALISPSGMGMGDVKLAGLVGLYLGFHGWMPLALGAAAGFAIGAIVGCIMLVAGRAGLKTSVPFGPSMLAGAVIVLIVARLM